MRGRTSHHPLQRFPAAYVGLTLLFSWLPWSVAAYGSAVWQWKAITTTLALIGLLGPCLAAFVMVHFSGNASLWHDVRARLIATAGISVTNMLFVFALMPLSLLLATLLSVQGGYGGSEQFQLSGGFIGMLPLALVAAVCEELGWRSYGVDSLKGQGSIMRVCLLFAVLWAAWHIPLFFIEQTYQHGLRKLGPLYVANFFVSVLPAAILSTWFYYKSRRSILAAVMFHFMLVAFSELLQTEPFTKCLLTGILMVVSLGLIALERDFFFSRQHTG